MSVAFINPGAGTVRGRTTFSHARQNLEALVKEAGLPGLTRRVVDRAADEGCYHFELGYPLPGHVNIPRSRWCPVGMPGLPLRQVRFVDDVKQDCLEFPRLYINGNSWLWKYAVSIVRDFFGEEMSG